MKFVKWLIAAALLWPAVVCPVSAQETFSKWETGIKAGLMSDLTTSRSPYTGSRWANNTAFTVGGYATRFFNPKWSLRGELLYNRNGNAGQPIHYISTNGHAFYRVGGLQQSVSLILAPRYRVNSWLDLELATEARVPVGPASPFESTRPLLLNAWAGAALHLGRFEVNVRYAPGYKPQNEYGRSAWTHGLQLGLSTRLFQSKKN